MSRPPSAAGRGHEADPPSGRDDEARARHLLAFLGDHDAECPRCGYNLRGLTRPVCPECREALELTVGASKPRFEWLLAAIAPGIFSGIAAALLAIPIIAVPIAHPGAGPAPPFFVATDLFGWASGVVALLLLWKRYAFLRLGRRAQAAWAIVLWLVHVAAFGLLLLWIL